MYTKVFVVCLAVASALPMEDTVEVKAEKAKFAAAFAAAEKGEHAALAPINADVQAAAPVFTGVQIPSSYLVPTMDVAEATAKHPATVQGPAPVFASVQIPTAYIADTMELADAKAKHVATVQAPAPVHTGVQIPTAYIADTMEVADATATFSAAFAAVEKGEHAALAPINADVQAAAPVFTGVQIPTSYIADTMEVADAKAKHVATVQAPAPVHTGVQIPTAYIADTMEVADAKAAFTAAFDDAAAGGLVATQVPAPVVPLVAAVKAAAVPTPVATPVVYGAGHPYTGLYYHGLTYAGLPTTALTQTGLTYTGLPTPTLANNAFAYSSLTHGVVPLSSLTYTHGLPYAGFLPYPFLPAAAPAATPAAAVAVEAE